MCELGYSFTKLGIYYKLFKHCCFFCLYQMHVQHDVTVKLKILDKWKIHNSFDISKLKLTYPKISYSTYQDKIPNYPNIRKYEQQDDIQKIIKSRVNSARKKK